MKKIIKTDLPINVPISQAVKAGDFIYVSGQVPVDPDTNELVDGGIEKQTEIVFKRINHILEAAGSSLEDVIKVKVFLTDINDFDGMNKVFEKIFSENPPARSCFKVELAIDVTIEAEVIAYKP